MRRLNLGKTFEKVRKTNIKKIKGATVALCSLSITAGVLLGGCGNSNRNDKATTESIQTTQETEMEDTTTVSTTEDVETDTEERSSSTEAVTESNPEGTSAGVFNSAEEAESAVTTETTNPPEWVVDSDTGMLIDNSNFIVQDNNGVDHVMTRQQYEDWLKGEYSWDE